MNPTNIENLSLLHNLQLHTKFGRMVGLWTQVFEIRSVFFLEGDIVQWYLKGFLSGSCLDKAVIIYEGTT